MKIVEVKFKMRIDEDYESLEEYKRDIRRTVQDSIYDSIVFKQPSTYTTGPYDWSIEEICVDKNDPERFHEYIESHRKPKKPDDQIIKGYKEIFNFYKDYDQQANRTMILIFGCLISSETLFTVEDCDDSIHEFDLINKGLQESDLNEEQKEFWKKYINDGLQICNRDKVELQRAEENEQYNS